MAVTTDSLTSSKLLPLEPTGLTPSFGNTPGFFSAEFNSLNPFDADFQNATSSPIRLEQASGSVETAPLPYASYQQDIARSATETAMRRNYDPSLVPTPGPRSNLFRSSNLKESVGPEAIQSSRLPPSPRGSPEALDPAFLMEKELSEFPPSYDLPPRTHSRLGSSRGIHGEVTPPTDDSRSPDDKDSKSSNDKSSQSRKPSNSRKRKSAEIKVPEIKLERQATPSEQESAESTPQPEMNDEKGSSTQDSKRKKFLERNRLAASKCRQKKKEWANNLEERARYQAQENKVLRANVAQLRDECLYLKNFLLSTHSGCQCVGVKNYLMKEAQLSQQVAAGLAAGGVMPIAGMIHPSYATMMGMGPPMQHGMDMMGERGRSQSVGSSAMSDGRLSQGSISPQQ